MTPERWQRIELVFGRAVELDAPERESFVKSSCSDDAELYAEVMALLASDDQARASLRAVVDRAPMPSQRQIRSLTPDRHHRMRSESAVSGTKSRSERRWDKLWRFVVPAGWAVHALLIPTFALLGMPTMAWFNVGSTVIYGAAFLMYRRNAQELALWLVFAEVIAHAWAGVYVMGWEAGTYLPLFLTAVILARPGLSRSIRVLSMPIPIGALIAMRSLAPPTVSIDPSVVSATFVLGVLVTFGLTAAIVLVLNDAADRLEIELAREHERADIADRARQLAEALLRVTGAPARDLAPGAMIDDRYRVVCTLGKGGMGTVHEVERTSDGKHFALKVVNGVTDRDALVRFAREAQIAAQLDHPNIVSVVDIDVSETGMLYIVMELVAGSSLADEKTRWGDRAWAQPIANQIAAALGAMHAKGIVHRDLKPANVLLADGVAKVTDFGIASLRFEESGDSAMSRGLTNPGAVMGTPQYMAPELANGTGDAGPSADVWSFGVLVHELLTGTLPFGEAPVLARLGGRAVKLTIIEPIVARCLDEDPSKRPAASELTV